MGNNSRTIYFGMNVKVLVPFSPVLPCHPHPLNEAGTSSRAPHWTGPIITPWNCAWRPKKHKLYVKIILNGSWVFDNSKIVYNYVIDINRYYKTSLILFVDFVSPLTVWKRTNQVLYKNLFKNISKKFKMFIKCINGCMKGMTSLIQRSAHSSHVSVSGHLGWLKNMQGIRITDYCPKYTPLLSTVHHRYFLRCRNGGFLLKMKIR